MIVPEFRDERRDHGNVGVLIIVLVSELLDQRIVVAAVVVAVVARRPGDFGGGIRIVKAGWVDVPMADARAG